MNLWSNRLADLQGAGSSTALFIIETLGPALGPDSDSATTCHTRVS